LKGHRKETQEWCCTSSRSALCSIPLGTSSCTLGWNCHHSALSAHHRVSVHWPQLHEALSTSAFFSVSSGLIQQWSDADMCVLDCNPVMLISILCMSPRTLRRSVPHAASICAGITYFAVGPTTDRRFLYVCSYNNENIWQWNTHGGDWIYEVWLLFTHYIPR
jgi:hypothetical protein